MIDEIISNILETFMVETTVNNQLYFSYSYMEKLSRFVYRQIFWHNVLICIYLQLLCHCRVGSRKMLFVLGQSSLPYCSSKLSVIWHLQISS